MKTRANKLMSLATLAALCLVPFADAGAESDRSKRRTNKQIQTCVSEIGRHADYDDALKVVHWIATLDQRNLVELEIKIETSVYLQRFGTVSRKYSASCVTDTMGDVVKFRIDAVDSDSAKDRHGARS